MFNKLVLVAALVTTLTACGGSNSSEPVDLTGSWKSHETETFFTATIADNIFEITLNDPVQDMQALYWKGTAPPSVVSGDIFISEGDVAAMEHALLASLLEEKEFTYEDDKIVFEYGFMGTTQTIRLERE